MIRANRQVGGARRGHAARFLTAIALLALSLSIAPPLTQAAGKAPPAPVREFWIEDFDATILIDGEGVVHVTEVIRFYFDGSFNGIYRDIPVRYNDNLGFDYKLRLRVVAVTDLNGEALRYELSDTGGGRRRITAWVPGAQDAARTVKISYRTERALRFFPEHDELYWNVTGTEWGVPIQAASATVMLPEGLEEEPRVTAFVGHSGERGEAWRARTTREREVSIETTRELAYGEGLTVVVGWPKGLVPEPGLAQRAGWLLRDNWPLIIPFLVFGLMFATWRRHGRDPDVGRSVMPMYHPPKDLTPAELGALVDERVDQRDIVATVVDLAVRGYLRIEETVEDGWFRDTTTTTFERLLPSRAELRPHEREVLAGLFEKGKRVTLKDLENKFHERLDPIRKHVYEELVEAGYFKRSPQTVRRMWTLFGVMTGFISLPFAISTGNLAAGVAGVASGVILIGFARLMPARTRAGMHEWYAAKGFEEFLGRTEGDRLRELEVEPSKFEAFLPFAMALGVAEQWGRAFEGLLKQPPQWYAGPHHGNFSASNFSQRMSSVSSSVGTAMATAPRSSSGSSGFSGGGSSGGGFGGGGGGAF
jgi:uncharacterized membrane protein